MESVGHGAMEPAYPGLFLSVCADVADKEIQQPIAVVIQEGNSRRVRHVINAGVAGDIAKLAATKILEEHIAAADGRHEKISISVIVDVCESSGHMNATGKRSAGLFGYVLEPAAAQISPKLVGPQLIDEIQIDAAVIVDVCRGNAGAMVVMGWLPPLESVVYAVLEEGDLAIIDAVCEMKIPAGFVCGRGLDLLALPFGEEPWYVGISWRKMHGPDSIVRGAHTGPDSSEVPCDD
jgi:hypothetical protein